MATQHRINRHVTMHEVALTTTNGFECVINEMANDLQKKSDRVKMNTRPRESLHRLADVDQIFLQHVPRLQQRNQQNEIVLLPPLYSCIKSSLSGADFRY